jgi:hypothetical protein
MAHFAQLNEKNVVIQVLVTDNNSVNEGYDWLIENLGGNWVKTSYNASIRKNFAGIGFTYDSERDAFIPPKPFKSWVLVEETCKWRAPIDYPDDGFSYSWNEKLKDWELIDFAELER